MSDLSLFSLVGLCITGIVLLLIKDVDDDDGPPDGGILTPVYAPNPS